MPSHSACCFAALWFFLFVVPVTKAGCEELQGTNSECLQMTCFVSSKSLHWEYWNCMCHDDCNWHYDVTFPTMLDMCMCSTKCATLINCTSESQHNDKVNCTVMFNRSCWYDNGCCYNDCCCDDGGCYYNDHCCHDDTCCYEDIPISTHCSYCYMKLNTSSNYFKIFKFYIVYRHAKLTTSNMRSTATTTPLALPSTTATPYISMHPVTNNNSNNIIVASVISGVLTMSFLLLLLIVISGILACTLYRRRAKRSIERHQSDMQRQLSTLQRMENTYCAHVPTQSTDAVYSVIHEGNTETSHHNTVLPPPTYSSLATMQLQDVKEQGTPSEYSVVTQENFSNRSGQNQNPVAPAGVGAGTVYSTVVRQDGKKVTVKLNTAHIHAEEEEEPGIQTVFSHGHTSSAKLSTNTSHPTKEEGVQDMDYFDDPDLLQQIRAQKQ